MPALTVLMPVYNAERFLREAIDSILQQTFTDFEFIIIDDASTDNSAAIITAYQDERIRFYQNTSNLGISGTLNKGISLAAAPLIARMDADDISHPHRLQRQYEYMQAQPECAMVSSLVEVVSEDGSSLRTDNFISEYFYYNLTFICWIYHPTVMYRKQAVEQVGMYSVPYAEDHDLFWQLTRRYKFYNLPEVLLQYRVTSQSLHQVLKKKEYELAQHQQLLRNFQYFVGPDFSLPPSHIDCLQHNFQPLLAEENVTNILQCLQNLDKITEAIIAKENVNRNIGAIREAAFYKRKYILFYFFYHLPKWKALELLVRDRKIPLLALILLNTVSTKVKAYF